MRIVDLCCGAGGAAMGLHRAFPDAEIVGVDVRPQPHYPFTFVQGDALKFDLSGFDFAWASPPCQEHTSLQHTANARRSGPAPAHHADIIGPLRQRLLAWGGSWIMENVVGAPLAFSAELCGLTFGLRVYRHRRFEAPFMLMAPPHLKHRLPAYAHRTPTNGLSRKESYLAGHTFASSTGHVGAYGGPAMGIDWMTVSEFVEAIPPAFSQYLAQFIPVTAWQG